MKLNRFLAVAAVGAMLVMAVASFAQPGPMGPAGPAMGPRSGQMGFGMGPGMGQMGPGMGQGFGQRGGRQQLGNLITTPQQAMMVLVGAKLDERELKTALAIVKKHQEDVQKTLELFRKADTPEQKREILQRARENTQQAAQRLAKLFVRDDDGQPGEQIVERMAQALDKARELSDEEWQRAKRQFVMRFLGQHRPGPMGPQPGMGAGPMGQPGFGRGQGQPGQGQQSPEIAKIAKLALAIFEKARSMPPSEYRDNRDDLATKLAKLLARGAGMNKLDPERAAMVVLRCPQSPQIIQRLLEGGPRDWTPHQPGGRQWRQGGPGAA